MPIYHLIGRDLYKNLPRELYVEAQTSAEAEAFASQRGIAELRAALVAAADVPPELGWQRVPSPDVPQPTVATRRNFKLAMLGVGIGLVLIAGYLFVNRAKEHLLRGDIHPKEPAGTTGPATPP